MGARERGARISVRRGGAARPGDATREAGAGSSAAHGTVQAAGELHCQPLAHITVRCRAASPSVALRLEGQ